MRIFAVFIFLLLFQNVSAQSGRVVPAASPSPAATTDGNPPKDLTVEQMFAQASGYSKNKFAEYEQKKVPFSESVYRFVLREQKQLAAKLAATANTRQNLAGEDFYFLGMLNWIAENFDGAGENLRKFLAAEKPDAQKLQSTRAVVVIISARQKNFDEAENLLGEYLKNEPQKASERARMEKELAAAYLAAKLPGKAAPHAEQSYLAAKASFKNTVSRAHGLNEILDAGLNVFASYKNDDKLAEADKTLENLRQTGVLTGSIEVYFAAIDETVKYLIETNRKPAAMKMYQDAIVQTTKDFPAKRFADDVIGRLKKREKHYKLLGETAPELEDIDKWFPGAPQTFANLRGKVVLIDFWATWCGPCLAAFPSLTEWQQTFQKDGFAIVGLTRYYGTVQNEKADNSVELEFLKNFRSEKNLPYDFAVAKSQTSQITYGATGLPTTVLIDRKGIVRYIETGTSASREEEIRQEIEKLLAEK